MTNSSTTVSASTWVTTTKQEYQDAITKCTTLLNLMHAADDKIDASSFKPVADLAKHGYKGSSFSSGTEANEMKGLAPIFYDINVGTGWAGASGSNIKIQHSHDRASGSEKDVRYPVSNFLLIQDRLDRC